MSTVEANLRQGSKSEPDTNMEVRFSTAEARRPSLRFKDFLLLSLWNQGIILDEVHKFQYFQKIKEILVWVAMLDDMACKL